MKLFDLILDLIKKRWHGELRIKFYDGQIKHAEKESESTQYVVDWKTIESMHITNLNKGNLQ